MNITMGICDERLENKYSHNGSVSHHKYFKSLL